MQAQTEQNACLGELAFIPTEGIADLTAGRLRVTQSLGVTEPEFGGRAVWLQVQEMHFSPQHGSLRGLWAHPRGVSLFLFSP